MPESEARSPLNRDTAFEEIEPTGKLTQLLDYWRHLRPRDLPRRTDIDLMRLAPELLPNVFLVDVLEQGQRFRWRLIGTQIVQHAGTDDTGLDLEIGVIPAMRAEVMAQNRQVVRERRPLCHRGYFVSRGLQFHRYERVMLPVLSDDGTHVDTILGCSVFASDSPPDRERTRA